MRTEQEYDYMEGRFKHSESALSPFFLRKAYKGTSAEIKDETQANMHDLGRENEQASL